MKLQTYLDADLIVVIYHGWCQDGINAAYVISEGLTLLGCSFTGSQDIVRLPFTYGPNAPSRLELEALTHFCSGKSNVAIVMVDVSLGSYEGFEKVAAIPGVKHICVIDHHSGAVSDLEQCLAAGLIQEYVFDNHQSGAMLAFGQIRRMALEEADAQTDTSEAVYRYVSKHVLEVSQDRDLWLNIEPNCEAYIAVIVYRLFGHGVTTTPKTVGQLALLGDQDISRARHLHKSWDAEESLRLGTALSANYKAACLTAAREAQCLVADDHSPLYICNNSGQQASDVCSLLYEKHGGVACSWVTKASGDVKLSFRSHPASRVSALEMAKHFGGGGHERAAGCYTKALVDDWRWQNEAAEAYALILSRTQS